MGKTRMHKSIRGRLADTAEIYQPETTYIDSSTSAVAACGSCHDLTKIHSGSHVTAGVGVGASIPGVSISATMNPGGSVSSSFQVGNGFVASASANWGPTGPKYMVGFNGPSLSTPQRSVSTSGNTSTSAQQDKTRTN